MSTLDAAPSVGTAAAGSTSTTSAPTPSSPTNPAPTVSRRARPAPAPIPLRRLVAVELRKMFDTRSGAWLLAAVAVTALLASASVAVWAPDAMLTYSTFTTAVGLPMGVIVPIIAILSVTSEWSQRTGLTTFTLVPQRGRSIAAKALATLLVAVVSIALAAAIGTAGNLAGAAGNGLDAVWDLSGAQLGSLLLAHVLGVGIGFMLGVALRSSPAAMVAYLVYVYVLTGVALALAAVQPWFADLQPWVDFNFTQGGLYEAAPVGGEGWAQLAVTTLLWLVLPLVLGLWRLLRSEVK